MDDRVHDVLLKFKEDVADVLKEHMKKMILFGSYARGDYGEDSDIDVMFLVDLTGEELRKFQYVIWDMAYDVLWEQDIDISAKLRNEREYDHWKNYQPFYSNVDKEGVIL